MLFVDDCIQNSVDSADSIEIPIVPDLSQHLKTAAGSASSLPSQTVTYCDRECDELLCSDDESFSSDCDNDYVPSSVSQSEEELDSDGTDCEGHDISHGVKLCRKGDQPKAGESEQEVCELMRSGGDQKSRLVMKSRNLGIQNIVSNSNITDNNNAVSDTEVGTKCGRNQNIVVMLTNNSTSRKYDRKSYCCFCGVQQSKLVRHFKLKHQDEDDIRSLIGERTKPKRTWLSLSSGILEIMSTTVQWSNVEVDNFWCITGQKLMPTTAASCHAIIAMDIFQRKASGNTCAH